MSAYSTPVRSREAERCPSISRRRMLQASGLGLGSLALSCLLHDDGLLADDASPSQMPRPPYNDLRPRPGHFPAQARSMIQLYQDGGPSQVDLFDPKPELT